MTIHCVQCGAAKWDKEPPALCCSSGKVRLPRLADPPPLLKQLMNDETIEARHFRRHIRKYNASFQMTSFGANTVTEAGFMPTFKIQGQIYHRIGSLLPLPNTRPQYLQVYFLGDHDAEANVRCDSQQGTRLDVTMQLQNLLHANNTYIRSFKMALEREPVACLRLKIDADKKPPGEHPGRFNTPVCSEVAAITSEDQSNKRDIVLYSRGGGLQRVSETHRSYDALQYPLLLPYGEDGYHFAIPLTGRPATKHWQRNT